jgi:hypothetical protein
MLETAYDLRFAPSILALENVRSNQAQGSSGYTRDSRRIFMISKRNVLMLLTATVLGACVPQATNPQPVTPTPPPILTAPGTPVGLDKVCPPEQTLTIAPINSSTPDTEPNPFCFAPALNVNPDQTVAISSNTITVRGVNQPTPLTATNGATVYVNDQYLEYFSAQSTPKMVKLGDKIRVLGSASNRLNDSVAYTVTIGGVSDTFYIITRAK